MAATVHATQTAATQSIGKVFIMYGTAKAVSPEGTERALGPNSPIFANDRIITGSDGSLSIVFDDPANSQLNLGRMSEIVIDEEVYDAQVVDVADAAGEVAEIQEAMLAEGFDPTTELPAPAAGDVGSLSDGGGHPTVQFDETGDEVTPTSGADTTGVEGDFLDPLGGVNPGTPAGGGENFTPTIGPEAGQVEEADLPNDTTSGSFDIVSIDPVAAVRVQDVNGEWQDVTNGGTVAGAYGILTVDSQGGWEYTLSTNTLDHGYADNGTNSIYDTFALQVEDSNGDTEGDTLTITVVDDVPVAVDDATTQVSEDANVVYNVMTNTDGTSDDQGADGAVLTNAAVNMGQGSVTYLPNGEITYDPVDGEEGTVVIDYTITDADGDTSDAQLTVTLGEDSTPTIGPESATVYEAALTPDGSELNIPPGGSFTATDTLDITTGNDSIAEVRIGGATGVLVPVGGSTGVIAGSEGGRLVVTESADGVYTWTYTQINNTGHDQPINDTTVLDSFDLWVKDSDGNTASNTLEITIFDDVPILTKGDSADTLNEADLVTDEVLTTTGTLNFDYGADGPGSIALSAEGATWDAADNILFDDDGIYKVELDPESGVSGECEYTFTLLKPLEHQVGGTNVDALDIQFTATIVDGDNDSSFQDITVTVNDSAPTTTDVTGFNIYFHTEDAGYDNMIGTYELVDGIPTNPQIIVSSTDDYLNHPGQELVLTTTNPELKLFIISDGADHLVLTDQTELNLVLNDDGTVTLQVNGTDYSATDVFFMDKQFNDDREDHMAVLPDGQDVDDPPELLSSLPNPSAEIIYVGIEDLHGINDNSDHDYNDAILFVDEGIGVSEAGLEAGTLPNELVLSASGNLFDDGNIVESADGPVSVMVNGDSNLVLDLDGTNGVPLYVFTDQGTLTLSDNGDWSYTLTDNTDDHDDNISTDGDGDRGYADQVPEEFILSVTDSDGSDGGDINLTINIHDDGPEISAGANPSILFDEDEEEITIEGAVNITYGADGPAEDEDDAVQVSILDEDVTELFSIDQETGDMTITVDDLDELEDILDDLEESPEDLELTVTIMDDDGDIASVDLDLFSLIDDGMTQIDPPNFV